MRVSVRLPSCRFVAVVLVTSSLSGLFETHDPRGAVTTTGEVRQPRNIYELAYGIDHTLRGILTGEELRVFSTMSPEEIRSALPDLYERIRLDVKGWTDEWLAHVSANVEPIPSAKLKKAQEAAARIDGLLQKHFAERRWPYRAMQVVFLPPKVLLDERQREKMTGGMFMPFYPDVFFATVDWPIPLEIVLVHESLHYNKKGSRYGSRLTEGITETATRDLVERLGLATAGDLRRNQAYPEERKGVDYLLDEMMRRAGLSREEGTERFLVAYLTGDQTAMAAIFGAEAWKRVLALGDSRQTWQTHRIQKALASP